MNNPGIVVHAAGDLRVQEMGEPRPAADEAVVEIAYGGVCGSDLHYWQHGAAGASILREPMVLGHEVSGTVVAPAADGTGPGAGVRVAAHPLTPQGDGGTPWPRHRPNLAPASTYLGSAMHLPHTQGAFARRVASAIASGSEFVSPTTWAEWTEAVKAKTGRKGKGLFMPLRKALTGRERGPEMADFLPLMQALPRARAGA